MDLGVAPNHPFAILSRAVWVAPSAVPIAADLWYLRRTSAPSVFYDLPRRRDVAALHRRAVRALILGYGSQGSIRSSTPSDCVAQVPHSCGPVVTPLARSSFPLEQITPPSHGA